MNQNDKHWLVRETTIRKLWILLYIFLSVSVIVEFFVSHHERFGTHGIDSSIGFSAWFGFISCLLMVVFAKLLGLLIKRPDDFYTSEEQSASSGSASKSKSNA